MSNDSNCWSIERHATKLALDYKDFAKDGLCHQPEWHSRKVMSKILVDVAM